MIYVESSCGGSEYYEYDQNGNCIMYSDSYGNIIKYESEFYDNGQLKRIDDLIIPYFKH